MNYLIDQNEQFTQSYSIEEVQKLIDENKIGLNTLIWTKQWSQWKQIKDTDFNLQKAISIRIKKKPFNPNFKMVFGAILFIGGIIVTVYSLYDPSNGGIIAWGAILSGLIYVIKGFDEYNNN